MSVGPKRSSHHVISVALSLVVAFSAAGLSGCASRNGPSDQAAGSGTQTPNESVLSPATQALQAALSAHADQLAPRSVAAARRRITLARGILFNAAQHDRAPTSDEKARVKQLVDAAMLDAREARIETQAMAVQIQLAQMQNNGSNTSGNSDTGTGSPMSPTPDNSSPDGVDSNGNGVDDDDSANGADADGNDDSGY